MVAVDGTPCYVHILVGELFFIGPRPLDWEVWDHIDQDKTNNDVRNLHPTTLEVNALNTPRHRAFWIWPEGDPSKKVLWDEGQRAAARKFGIYQGALNNVLHKSNRQKTTGGYCAEFVE